MTRPLLSILTCFAVFAMPAGATAAERFAEPGGDGPAASCPASNPCGLLDATTNSELSDGDVITLLPGVYSSTAKISLLKDVTLRGLGPASATRVDLATSDMALDIQHPDATVSDLEFRSAFTLSTVRIGNATATHVIVRNSEGAACEGLNATLINVLCESTEVVSPGFKAITYSSSPVTIQIIGSTIVGGASHYGAELGSFTSAHMTAQVVSSIVIGPDGGFRLATEGLNAMVTLSATNSNYPSFVKSGLAGTIDGTPAGSGTNQTAAPGFVDAAAGDYSLVAGSPAIDAGTAAASSGDLDLAGLARISGAAPDIGAYEYQWPPVSPEAPTPAVDTTKPRVTITKKPKSKTRSRKVRITFKADEKATFQCKLDKARKWKKCKSPYKKTVKRGKHTLQIRATDTAGNRSAVRKVRWRVTA